MTMLYVHCSMFKSKKKKNLLAAQPLTNQRPGNEKTVAIASMNRVDLAQIFDKTQHVLRQRRVST
jgi:hypothetical protein